MGIAGVMYPRQLSTGVVFNHTIKAETKRRVLSNTQLSAYEHRHARVRAHEPLETEARSRSVDYILHSSPHNSSPVSWQHRGRPETRRR